MFTSRPQYAWQNFRTSESINAEAATITTEDGQEVPGVAVFKHGKVSEIITAEAAQRLALQIVDALEEHKREKPIRRDTEVSAAFADLADQ